MTKLTCPECGQSHDELPVYGFHAPDIWTLASPAERSRDFEFGPDLCRYKDEYFMLRGRLQIPVTDWAKEPFEFSVWVGVTKDNWWRYRTTFLDFNASGIGVFYGWLANQLPGYDLTVNLQVAIAPVGQGLRPKVTVIESPGNVLMLQQLKGVELDHAMRYLHKWGGF